MIGLNIGKNAATPIERALDDYLTCLRQAMPVADYVTINISSPEHPPPAPVAGGQELDALLGAIDAERAAGSRPRATSRCC